MKALWLICLSVGWGAGEPLSLATPEATLEAFLEALIEGNVELAARCYLPQYRADLRAEIGSVGQQWQLMRVGVQTLARFQPHWRETFKPELQVWGEVARAFTILELPFAWEGADPRFPVWLALAREGEDWLIEDDPRQVLLALTRDWQTAESPHFVYHFPHEGLITRRDMIYHEYHFRRIQSLMEVEVPDKIHYFRAATPEQLLQLGISNDLGEGYYGVVICATSRFAHEVTHAMLTQQPPNNWLSEGVAVLWGQDWDRPWEEPPHETARRMLQQGQLLPLERLIHTPTYLTFFPDFNRSAGISYPQAASFVHFLTTQYPRALFHQLFARANLRNVEDVFRELYGRPIQEVDAAWRAWLEQEN